MKYGKEQEVQQILTEYRSFVGTRNIFQEFDRAFHEMQQVSEAYKKDTELSKYLFLIDRVTSLMLCFMKNMNMYIKG